jgi:sugar/nucleoside kinase (ribokinase family)
MSSDLPKPWLPFVIAGCLNRDYILPISGPPQIDVLGGNLTYAAVGLHLWGGTAGLVARVGENFPMEELVQFHSLGFDLSGVKVHPDSMDLRRFMVHVDSANTKFENPVHHFADRGLPFPAELMGYHHKMAQIDSHTTPLKHSIHFSDVPEAYLEVMAVHICPIDYLSHLILPSIFKQGQASTITLSPSPGTMTPSFWEEIPGLLSDLTAFITEEQDVRNLFQGRKADLWEMAEVLGTYGPEYILIRTNSLGCYLYDRVSGKRWVIPDYRTTVVDPTGGTDAFAGAFLVGYRQDYDPVEAAVMGSIAASMVVEGSGVFYALDALPELKEARRDALRELVREI